MIGVIGTHNLRAAVFRDNRVELIKDELGNDSTPAFVGFILQSESADNLARYTTVLGRHAYDLAQRNLSHPVYGLKKLLGRKPDDHINFSERGNWPFEIAADQDRLAAVSIPATKINHPTAASSSSTNQRSYCQWCFERWSRRLMCT